MKEDADFLVLLSHMGTSRTRDLLGRVKDFDIAVTAHGKPMIKKAEKVGKTLLLGTGGLGQYLGRSISNSRLRQHGIRQDETDTSSRRHRDTPGIREIFKVYGIPLTDKGGRHH